MSLKKTQVRFALKGTPVNTFTFKPKVQHRIAVSPQNNQNPSNNTHATNNEFFIKSSNTSYDTSLSMNSNLVQKKTSTCIKYIKQILSNDCLLIGNENQLDLVQFQINNHVSQHQVLWSLSNKSPIQGITPPRNQENKILIWTHYKLFIYQFNNKNIRQSPKVVKDITFDFHIVSVQFVKRNTFLVCSRSHTLIYQISEIDGTFFVQMVYNQVLKCPEHFQVLQVTELSDNTVKVFYTNMAEDTQKQVFGLYYKEIQYDFVELKVSDLKKVYEIKKSLRHEINLINISKTIFLMSLKTDVLAVKNGSIIDNVSVNFKFQNCFIRMISKDKLVHVLQDKIEFYHLNINFSVVPERIIVKPFDSIHFQRSFDDRLIDIVKVKNGYGIFFQSNPLLQNQTQTDKGILKYWYKLTYPIKLKQKISQLFPSAQEIQNTDFETLDMYCDMIIKMGLSEKQAYRQLWRKTKRDKERDFQILLSCKQYEIITNETRDLLKFKAQKVRDIIRNQTICLDILRPRLFQSNCTIKNFQQYCQCHFFNIKLNLFKQIQVEARRIQIQEYTTLIKPVQHQINSVLSFSVKNFEKIDWPENKNNNKLASIKMIGAQQEEMNEESGPSQQQAEALSRLAKLFEKKSQHSNSKIVSVQSSCKKENMKEWETKIKQQNSKEIRIGIKDFNHYKNCQIKQHFLEIVADFMNKSMNSKESLQLFSLRTLIRNFRMPFRLCYKEILLDLIHIYKHKILVLLKLFPELLPLQYKSTDEDLDEQLYMGVWVQCECRELEENLFIDDLTTIDNKDVADAFVKDIWFLRNSLSQHGVITQRKEQIKKQFSAQKISLFRSDHFYLFFSEIITLQLNVIYDLADTQRLELGWKRDNLIIELEKEIRQYDKLLQYVENQYEWVPEHIRGLVPFYQGLYQLLGQKGEPLCPLYQFLQKPDFELFNTYFTIERKRKGFIIDCIVPLYQNFTEDGESRFIKSVQSYFAFNPGQITDLKTLLNRLNGQKLQFHIRFESLYDSLLRAVMNSVRVGTGNDLPLEQLLIYVRNVPFSSNNRSVFEKLLFIQEVSYEVESLQEAQVNMTLSQIRDNPEKVITALVKSELARSGTAQVKSARELGWHLCKSLTELDCIRGHLYADALEQYVPMVFLTKLLQHQQLIPIVGKVLKDPQFGELLHVSERMIEAVVTYSYRKRLSSYCKRYLDSKQYILDLLHYLPIENHSLIELQIQYCQVFEACGCSVSYPISLKREIPTLDEIEHYIEKISSQKLQKLNISVLFQIFERMRTILEPNLQQNPDDLECKKLQFVKILHQFKFFKFLRNKQFNNAIQTVESLIDLGTESPIVHLALFVEVLSQEVSHNSKKLLAQALSYYYGKVKAFTACLKKLVTQAHTTQEFDAFLNRNINRSRKVGVLVFCSQNQLLKPDLRDMIGRDDSGQFQASLCRIVGLTCQHLINSNQLFAKAGCFEIFYRLLMLKPFQVAKFICYKKDYFNLRLLRLFFSFMSQEIIFDSKAVLNFAKTLFLILFNCIRKGVPVNQIISQYSAQSQQFQQSLQIDIQAQELKKTEKLLIQSYESMERKIKYFEKANMKIKIERQQEKAKIALDKKRLGNLYQHNFPTHFKNEQTRLTFYLNNFSEISHFQPYQYLYKCDNDDTYIQKGVGEFVYPRIQTWPSSIDFDEYQQRHDLLIEPKNIRLTASITRPRKKSQFLPDKYDEKKTQQFSLNSKNKMESIKLKNIQVDRPGDQETYLYPRITFCGSEGSNLKNSFSSGKSSCEDDELDLLDPKKIQKGYIQFDKLLTQSSQGYKAGAFKPISNEKLSAVEMKNFIFKSVNSDCPKIDSRCISTEKAKWKDEFESYIKNVCKQIFYDKCQPFKFKVKLIEQILQDFYVVNTQYDILKVFSQSSEINFDGEHSIKFSQFYKFSDLFMQTQDKTKHILPEYFKLFFSRIKPFINNKTIKFCLKLTKKAFLQNEFCDEIVLFRMQSIVSQCLEKYPGYQAIRVNCPQVLNTLSEMICQLTDVQTIKKLLKQYKKENNKDKFNLYRLAYDMSQTRIKSNVFSNRG